MTRLTFLRLENNYRIQATGWKQQTQSSLLQKKTTLRKKKNCEAIKIQCQYLKLHVYSDWGFELQVLYRDIFVNCDFNLATQAHVTNRFLPLTRNGVDSLWQQNNWILFWYHIYYFCYGVRQQYLFLKNEDLFRMLITCNFQFCCRGAARDFKPCSYGNIR